MQISESSLPRGRETILLVDDEEPIRLATARILERLGYKVLQAGTADQALQLATLTRADLLLVDVVLPQMSGLKLAHKISAIRPDIHILYFSAYTSEDVLDDQMEDRPGVGFIQKPFTAGDMARTIRNLLDTPISPPLRTQPTPGGSESILVVDDDPQTRRFISRTLERLGYRVLEAELPDQAMIIAHGSVVHLIVMDVVMPQMTGPELARAIAELSPQARFLYVSGKAPEDLIQEQRSGEAEALFLQKPFTSDEIGRAVRGALDGSPQS